MFRTLVVLFGLAGALYARADGLQSLERFAREVNSGTARFTQVVTTPAREGLAARSKTSSGEFFFARPGRFRFEYTKPFAQSLVADGQTLWMYDRDLQQVTARKQAEVLDQTPAALLASSADLSALRRLFRLESVSGPGGLVWVQATPLQADTQIRGVRLGFREGSNPEVAPLLSVLEIDDSFGQQSVMRFEGFMVNPKLPAQRFEFTPPAGVDVLRQ